MIIALPGDSACAEVVGEGESKGVFSGVRRADGVSEAGTGVDSRVMGPEVARAFVVVPTGDGVAGAPRISTVGPTSVGVAGVTSFVAGPVAGMVGVVVASTVGLDNVAVVKIGSTVAVAIGCAVGGGLVGVRGGSVGIGVVGGDVGVRVGTVCRSGACPGAAHRSGPTVKAIASIPNSKQAKVSVSLGNSRHWRGVAREASVSPSWRP